MRERTIRAVERDMSRQPLSAEELDALIGDRPVTDFLNPRNELFRERGFKGNPPDRAEALRLMAEHSNLIRRPLLIVGDRIAFGFDAAAWEALLSGGTDKETDLNPASGRQ